MLAFQQRKRELATSVLGSAERPLLRAEGVDSLLAPIQPSVNAPVSDMREPS